MDRAYRVSKRVSVRLSQSEVPIQYHHIQVESILLPPSLFFPVYIFHLNADTLINMGMLYYAEGWQVTRFYLMLST